jgi:hypothetical protein
MDQRLDTWTAEGVKGGLIRFYHEIAGVGLVFPSAVRSIAVEGVGMGLIILRPIEGLEFVEETVAALGVSTELANHLFRECWAVGTGHEELSREFGWNDREIEAHNSKVATAADLVALWHNSRITIDPGPEAVSGAVHAAPAA